MLERHEAALCWADRGSRLLTPQWVTADWGYVRLHEGTAHPRPSYGRAALKSWLERIVAAWPASADVFVFFNNDTGGAAVRNAEKLQRLAER